MIVARTIYRRNKLSASCLVGLSPGGQQDFVRSDVSDMGRVQSRRLGDLGDLGSVGSSGSQSHEAMNPEKNQKTVAKMWACGGAHAGQGGGLCAPCLQVERVAGGRLLYKVRSTAGSDRGICFLALTIACVIA
jgi:hypothetical protein